MCARARERHTRARVLFLTPFHTTTLRGLAAQRASVGRADVVAQSAVGEDVDGRVALGHHEGDVHDARVAMPVEVGAVKDRGREPAAHEQPPHDGQLLQQRHGRTAFKKLRIRRRDCRRLRRRDGLLRGWSGKKERRKLERGE